MSDAPSMFNDRPAAAAALPQSNYIQPTLGHGLRIWWAFFWRNSIIAAILTALAGLTAKALYERGAVSGNALRPLLQISSFVFEYASAFFVMHYIVGKKFQRFRIKLIPVNSGEDAEALPPTMKRTLPIWWTFSWRSFIYGLVFNFVANIPVAFLTGAVSFINPSLAQIFAQVIRLAIGGAVALFVIYSNILDEDFASFRVVLAPNVAIPAVRAVVANPPMADMPNPNESSNPIG
jgi:hypothetical protein